MSNKKRKYSRNTKWYYKSSTWVIGILGFILLLLFFVNNEQTNALAYVGETRYSWGEIPILGGDVEYQFTIKNDGTDPLKVYPITTSCHCTQAQLITTNEEGPIYTMLSDLTRDTSWRGSVLPGEEGIIKVVFDPLYHGPTGTGPIVRTVTVKTNDKRFDFRLDGVVIPGHGAVAKKPSYTNISAVELNQILDTKDVFLLDVHIPEQSHIAGTDAFIDYTQISNNLNKLPQDKNTEIIVYCRSGNMSKSVSEELVSLGYSNIKNLENGIIEWQDAGFNIDNSTFGTFN